MPPTRRWTRGVRAAAILLGWLGLTARCEAADTPPIETAIEATYLYKFAAFVDWPTASFSSPGAPLVICIVGDDPFGVQLARAVSGERVGDRPLELRHLPTVDRNAGCHIAYVAGSDAQPLANILATLRGAPVLTVTGAPGDGRDRGIIQFVIVDNHVRFAIDAPQAVRSGLVISSKLLSLGVAIGP
jgi:hypothetical protein